MYFTKAQRRDPMSLSVVALIDVCSIIIIFLIMGTYFGESSVVIPTGIEVPKSVNKETVENAPQVMIANGQVTTSFIDNPIALELFHAKSAGDELAQYKERVKQFVAAIPAEARQSGVLMNIVADQTTPYRDIFDVVSVFRESGFQSILFVAQGQ